MAKSDADDLANGFGYCCSTRLGSGFARHTLKTLSQGFLKGIWLRIEGCKGGRCQHEVPVFWLSH